MAKKKRSTKKAIISKISEQKNLNKANAGELALAKKARTIGDIKEADYQCRKVLKKDPNNFEAMLLMGEMAFDLQQFTPAKTLFEWAIRINPKLVDAHFRLGLTLEKLGDQSAAIKAYKNCIQLDQNHIGGLKLARLLHQFGFVYDAIALFRLALHHDENNASLYDSLSLSLNSAGETKEALNVLEKALQIDPSFKTAISNRLLVSHYDPDITPEELFGLHKKVMGGSYQSHSAEFHPRNIKHNKIRVGYVSPDFHVHSVTDFFEPLLSHHDHSKYEVFCYYNNVRVDRITEKLMSLADHWVSVVDMTDEQLKSKIQEDEIDILVDLTGHMGRNRLSVFTLKPAPIQVTWLGYPNTTGIPEIDYRFTDEIADPKGVSDQLHTEKLIRLPNGFLCYRCAETTNPAKELPQSSQGVFTFGSFNNISKVSLDVIKVWSAILTQVPNSRILLKGHQFIDGRVKQKYLQLFKDSGVEIDRVILLPSTENRQEHFELYNQVDLALDPFPYNGTTTTCEALWMGVATVTYKGNSHAARVGASIMNRIGLGDFVATDIEAYISKAVHCAKNPLSLSSLRLELRERMIKSDLCNGKRFAKQVEAAYQDMLE